MILMRWAIVWKFLTRRYGCYWRKSVVDPKGRFAGWLVRELGWYFLVWSAQNNGPNIVFAWKEGGSCHCWLVTKRSDDFEIFYVLRSINAYLRSVFLVWNGAGNYYTQALGFA